MGQGHNGHPKRSWFYYISDEGIAEALSRLFSLPYLGTTLKFAIPALVAFGLFHTLLQPFAPSDWVEVTVRNVPRGIRQIYLIADGRDGVKLVDAYHSKVTAFAGPGGHWYWNSAKSEGHDSLQWPVARRYGALAQKSDGAWELWWLGPAELDGPSVFRYVVGCGRAEIRLPDESRAMVPSVDFVDRLGLSDLTATP